MNSIMAEYPLNGEGLQEYRNLEYMVKKEQLSVNLPYSHPLYEDSIDELKNKLGDAKNAERRLLTVRLARTLPFIHRIKMLEMC